MSGPAHAALLPVFRKIGAAHSPSGLFTPLTNGNSGSATPELQLGEAELKDETPTVAVEEFEEPTTVSEEGLPAVEVTEAVDEANDSSGELLAVDDNGDLVPLGWFVLLRIKLNPVANANAITTAAPETVSAAPGVDRTGTPDDLSSLLLPHEDAIPEGTADAGREQSASIDDDADAEGEDDPDYVPSEGEAADDSSVAPAEDIVASEVAEEAEELMEPIQAEAEAEAGAVEEDATEAEPAIETLPTVEELPAKEVQTLQVDDVAEVEQPDVTIPFSPVDRDDPFESKENIGSSLSTSQKRYVSRTVRFANSHNSFSGLTANARADAAEEVDDSDTQTELAPSQETVVDESRDGMRPLKRKRRSPPTVEKPTRQLRPRTTKSTDTARAAESTAAKSKKSKGKGKQRAREDSDDEDTASIAHSAVSEETSGSGSSSAAAQRLLIPASRTTSRASSVVSNAPSTYSAFSLPSPTIMRMVHGDHHAPAPYVHEHGVLRHRHGAPPVVSVLPPPVRRQPSKPPSLSDASASASGPAEAGTPSNAGGRSQRASAEPAPTQPQTSQSSRAARSSPHSRPSVAASTSSPVTRANCRYHTISLPRDEVGHPIFFAVPGCSLGNGELMKEESIRDHGDVNARDIPNLVMNVEDLNLSPYLIGILRRLVGVDLLREHEVLYLPREGDGVTVKKNRTLLYRAHSSQVESISAAQRESISARTLSNGGLSRRKDLAKTASMPPPSQASASTSGGSSSHVGKLSERGSIATSGSLSGSDLSDLDDDRDEDMPARKRVKNAHREAEQEPEAAKTPVDPEPELQSPPEGESSQGPVENGNGDKIRRRQPRRSRKLGTDAAAYKPESDDSGEEEENAEGSKKRKRGGRKGGLKRTRTEEVPGAAAAVEGRGKRRRVRAEKAATEAGAEAGENA